MNKVPRTDDPHPLIHRLRAMGMSDAVMYSRLILEGWSDDTLAPALGQHRPSPDTEVPAPVTLATSPLTAKIISASYGKPVTRSDLARRVSPSMLVGILLACLGVGSAGYMFWKPPVVYSISLPSGNASSSAPIIYGALAALSDPIYYQSVKTMFMAQKGALIDANLSAMRLTVYIEGEKKIDVPILAKGRPGSWWETPAGLYKIQTKEKTHFSTFGEVAMPYSLDFQGNFFIHGWPTYPDGTPVSSTYSGGCIRLSTEDAAKVYALVEVGMPVVVYNEQPIADSFDYQLKAPKITAGEYLVADVKTGAVLTSKSAGDPAPIASITKLVTALVATEYINLDKTITVPKDAIVYTSVARLKPGQQVRAYDLLFLLLQESSNEAAETLAADRGRDQFVRSMNEKATAIGLKNTNFSDPSGAESDLSTPEDLFTLLRYIGDNRRFVFGITTGDLTGSAYGTSAFQNINDFNVIKSVPATLVGGKIGQTNEAGETYAGVFSVAIGGQDREIAVIVLGSKDAQTDVKKLLQFVKASYAPAQ